MLNTTSVSLSGGSIGGDLYGGGLGRLASGGDAAIPADVNGPVTVTTTNGSATNVFGCNNINGAPQRTVEVKIDGGNITNVYGGGNQAAYGSIDVDGTLVGGTPLVLMTNGTVGKLYGGGYGASASVNSTNVTMDKKVGAATTGTAGYIFGGGEQAPVIGNVEVYIKDGTVTEDVYGGGALANTNTGNWDPNANSGAGGWKVESSTSGNFYYPVKHVTKDVTVVTGYYTRSGSEGSYTYTEVTETNKTADEGITYYKKLPAEYTAEIHNILANGTTYKTTVSATGGVIGNIYGGGLGQLGANPIAAMVYGDVTVTVDGDGDGDGDEDGAVFSNELISYNYTAEEELHIMQD